MLEDIIENALIVKVAKGHVKAATRELMGEGWIVRQADMRADPAILLVQRDHGLPAMEEAKAEQMRKRIEFVYGKELFRFSALPVGTAFASVGCPRRMLKHSSTSAKVIETGIVIHNLVLPKELVERVL